MKTWLAAALLAACCWQAAAESWRFALVGDTPYSARERRELPKMLAAIAESGAELIIHVGDIKSGSDACSDDLLADRHALFDSSRIPLVYVPGDNEWLDCQRIINGSYDLQERLSHLRSLFFSSGVSLGQRRIPLERQSADYPEHVRFRLGPVLFVNVNVPGPDNNWGMTAKPRPEFLARNPAVLQWLKEGFALARRENLPGIVISMQANPDFRHFDQGLAQHGFRDLLELVRSETATFPGQVLLMHGDTHHQQVDQPLRDADNRVLERFTRAESYGYPFMGWVEVVIDSTSPSLFAFHPHRWPGH